MFRFPSQRSYEFHHGEPESFFQKARSESESAGPRKVQASGEKASGQACEARAESRCQASTETGREKASRQAGGRQEARSQGSRQTGREKA